MVRLGGGDQGISSSQGTKPMPLSTRPAAQARMAFEHAAGDHLHQRLNGVVSIEWQA